MTNLLPGAPRGSFPWLVLLAPLWGLLSFHTSGMTAEPSGWRNQPALRLVRQPGEPTPEPALPEIPATGQAQEPTDPFIDDVPQPEIVPPPVVASPAESGEEDWLKPLSAISLDVRPPAGSIPGNTAAPRFAEHETVDFRGGEGWTEALHSYPVAPFCFQPLYFEDITLERYGVDHGPVCQSVLSGARFYATVPALPYLMTLEPPSQCAYPDYWAHIDKPSIQQHRRAALVEAGIVAGLILLIP